MGSFENSISEVLKYCKADFARHLGIAGVCYFLENAFPERRITNFEVGKRA